ncbi:MAG: SH3 domain-containing protein [Anaerolineae bacterium]|nr:SH3 domain-containing protein [Anaerolineae bacterium]
MKDGLSLHPKKGPNLWIILGWSALVTAGILLVWLGFTATGSEETVTPAEPSPTTEMVPLQPTMGANPTPVIITDNPTPTTPPTAMPTPVPLPTEVPPTATPATPYVVVGADGVNVRTGPSTNYTLIGHLDPGAQASVSGRYNDWWQVVYNGGAGWVYGELVTPYNTDGVAQVQPPPAPTAAPVPPTATPAPTATAQPTVDTRGLQAISFNVENAPGPFNTAFDVWFNFNVRNGGTATVDIAALGLAVNGQIQRSWTAYTMPPGGVLDWRDHINQFELPSGAYNAYLRVCFTDGACVDLSGPIAFSIR